MKKNEEKQLARIAEMYYLEDKTQSEISKELNIHRTTISRLLKQSREEGIVQIVINYDMAGTYSLEKSFEEKFQLERAIIVPAAPEMRREKKDKLLGQAVNEFLGSIIKDEMTIGFSWGQTMSAVSDSLQEYGVEGITCVPMIGGPAGRLISEYHVNTITYNAAKKLQGNALLLDVPAILETAALKQALLDDQYNQQLIKKWDKLDVAIFGIGSPHLCSNEAWREFYGEDVLKALSEQNVVGDVVSRFYNQNGEYITSGLDSRIIGITSADLLNVETKIGVAESKEKASAILGALRGKYVNVLVTTEETAKEIMKIEEEQK